MPTTSIITAFYNAAEYIEYTLLSIANQKTNNLINIEYILVNDCSTDNSLEIVNNFISLYKDKLTIKLFDLKENLGCGGARKYGIDHASGDYFMFLDADDYYINHDFVLRATQTMIHEKADVIEYGVLFNDNSGNKFEAKSDIRKIFNNWRESIYWMFKDNTIKFNVWSKIYTKKIVNSFPYDTTREYEDIRTIPIWIKNAKKIIVEPSVEINYRAVGNSIIRDNGLRTRLGTIKAMTEICEIFKDNLDIVKALYTRAMIDMCEVMDNKNSLYEGYDEMSEYNTKLLSYIYPETYQNITFNRVISNDETNK